MTEPFVRRPAEKGLKRLVGSRRACIHEIEDLLAQAPRVRDVMPEQLAGIATQQGVDLLMRLGTARREPSRRLLEHCLADQELSEEESAEIEHLRRMLCFPSRTPSAPASTAAPSSRCSCRCADLPASSSTTSRTSTSRER